MEERGAVEDLSGGIAAVLVPRSRRNRDDQGDGGAVLAVECRDTSAVVADPYGAVRRRDRHAPGIDQISIDVGSDAGDVGLKIGPAVGIGARRNNGK